MSKPDPAPGQTEFDRFDAAIGHIARVPKAEVDKRAAREKKTKEKKRKAG
jgi:hypothetical protein